MLVQQLPPGTQIPEFGWRYSGEQMHDNTSSRVGYRSIMAISSLLPDWKRTHESPFFQAAMRTLNASISNLGATVRSWKHMSPGWRKACEDCRTGLVEPFSQGASRFFK